MIISQCVIDLFKTSHLMSNLRAMHVSSNITQFLTVVLSQKWDVNLTHELTYSCPP